MQYASAEVQDDRDVGLEIVLQIGHALQHASADVQGNPEVGLEVVRENDDALQPSRLPSVTTGR